MSSSIRRRLAIYLVVPLLLILAAYLVTSISYSKYTRSLYEFLVFLLVADLAIGLRGGWRNVATVLAATIFGLATIEFGSAAIEPNVAHYARGFSVSRPILGWGPSAPGVYHSSKTAANGTPIYSVDYTIDDHLLRRTLSGSEEPAVAFFGDSFTFGEGLPDSETLPQDYADLTGRKTRVLNFGFSGYGPQQFLRALETGMFDPLLGNTKLFVYLTVAWHAGRASCRDGFMARAPRYELRADEPVFAGACREGIFRFIQDAFLSSASFRRFAGITDSVNHVDVELYLAEIRRCAELIKQKFGGRLIVLYMSGNDPYLARSGFTDGEIKQRLRRYGIEVIDATLSPNDFPPGTALSIPGDGHPTAIANRARAMLLQRALSDSSAAALSGPEK